MLRPTIAAVLLLALAMGQVRAAILFPEPTSFGDVSGWTDLIAIGRVERTEPGRTISGCQATAATVAIEDVLIGSDAAGGGERITIEYFESCAAVPALGADIPTGRSIFLLINKGYELRRTQPGSSVADVAAETAFWRPIPGFPFVVDRGGTVDLVGSNPNSLDDEGESFADLADDLRESSYMAPRRPSDKVERVSPSWWFGLESAVLIAMAAMGSLIAVFESIARRGRGRRLAGALAMGGFLGVSAMLILPTPHLMRDLDFALNQSRRDAVVDAIAAGRLTETDAYGRRVLPANQSDLSQYGDVSVTEGTTLMVFFTRVTGFSPDPYCGYEYASFPDALDVDPLGSGGGVAESLGGGWYWICAS